MKVCVVGSGGREHALAVVLARTADVVVTPGNPGIPGSIDTPPEDIDADLYVIGPEQPLVDGLADQLRDAGKLVFGPGAAGAELEGSKAFMKEVVAAAGVPTARYAAFDDPDEAIAFLDTLPGGPDGGYVIKTDGLAAGK
ncbi:MAG TPA: phosphoribosylamine--glycine ligase, partial [Acidimicrobiaceae bacterium]|nr:phosphoribosylamine--glycine ligase [Acidimicrobiaceae bacterium]